MHTCEGDEKEPAIASDAVSECEEIASEIDGVPPVEGLVRASGNTAKRDAVVIQAIERDALAVRMRVDGKSYPAIATALGYGHRGNARRAVKRRLATMRADLAADVAELRQIECKRLDVALAAIMGRVRQGDLQAVDRMLRIMERRAAYEGLDQPRGLKVELAREIEGFIERVRSEFDDDVYERLLAIFAGELGSEAPERDPPEASGGEGEGGADRGGEPPAADAGSGEVRPLPE